MSFTGKKGPLLKSLAPAALCVCMLLFGGVGAFAQTDQEIIDSQSSDTDIDAEQANLEVPAKEGEIPESEEAITQGRQLFTGNCTVCHALNEVVVGPALSAVHERRPVPWLKDFIRNSQKVIQSGDAYAVNLYNEYNKTQMPAFNFSDEELESILAYIKHETDNPTQATAPAPGVGETPAGGGDEEVGIASTYLGIIVGALIVVLLLVVVVLVLVLAVLSKYLSQREDLDEADREVIKGGPGFGRIIRSRGFIALVIFLFLAIVTKTVIDGLYTIGVQQGYQPEQPIAFSHKLHAGQYQINCNYCHTGVYKAKSANIPSVNICMNCHNTIKQDSPEIQKLYAAIENDDPIEWVRVHNLPDLAFFSHAQHANVGGLDCQTCHGPVQEMEVVYQYSELTMGWCINCHRETDVKTEGNDYYDRLVELHNANTNEPMKVVDIGGLECSKCHY